MNTSARLVTALLAFFPAIGFSQQTISEYEKEKADGLYIGAAYYVDVALASECGHLFTDYELTIDTAVQQVRQRLSTEHRKVFDKWIASKHCKDKNKITNEIVSTAIKKLKSRNDQNTACLLLRDTMIQPIIKTATTTWHSINNQSRTAEQKKSTEPTITANDALFRSVDGQFRFLYPKTWSVKKGQGVNVKAKVVSDDGSSCNVVVRPLSSDIANLPNHQMMGELSEADFLNVIRTKWPDAVLLEGGNTYIDNRMAIYGYLDMTHNFFGGKFKGRVLSIMTVEFGKIYLLTCLSSQDLFSKYKSAFQDLVKTFVFEY